MESSTSGSAREPAGSVETSEHGLKADAISFWEGLVVALASTAPAYSLAAVIGSIAVIVGFFAPAALLLAFVPMFFIAAAFYWMNKADQDCGTTFAWVTRAIGPNTGWIAGWAVFMTGILVVGSLADVATYTFFDLIGAESLVDDKWAVIAGAVLLIAAMTTVCVIGTEASARLEQWHKRRCGREVRVYDQQRVRLVASPSGGHAPELR